MEEETKSTNTSVNSCVTSVCIKEDKLLENTVSGQSLCQTVNAQRLCLYDISYKLKRSATYDIGGTYTKQEPDIWLYYTTTECPGSNYLMSIFAYHRRNGTFSVGISDSNEINIGDKLSSNINDASEHPQHILLSQKLSWKTLVSAKSNVSHHIKTYCFNEGYITYLEDKILLIPITVTLNPQELDRETEQRIKLSHVSTMGSLTKRNKTDFVLESSSRKQYPTYKILLLGHSPVFRDMIRNSNTNSTFIDICDKMMELLIQYIHTGKLKEIEKDIASEVLDVAVKLKIKSLEDLLISALKD